MAVGVTGRERRGKQPAAAEEGTATRRRGAALEAAILAAAWDVLAEQGYAGFTYEAVAARAATSRPVLYRRWPTRHELLVAAVAHARNAHPIKVPDTGNLRDDAIGFLKNANAARARATARVSAQLMDYFRETGTSFSELRRSVGGDQASAFDIIVSRAVVRGELRTMPASARVLNLPFDLLRYEIFTTLRPVPSEAIVEIVDQVWLPLLRVSDLR